MFLMCDFMHVKKKSCFPIKLVDTVYQLIMYSVIVISLLGSEFSDFLI